jgi:tetratricopeptide (TPR) repeat protein
MMKLIFRFLIIIPMLFVLLKSKGGNSQVSDSDLQKLNSKIDSFLQLSASFVNVNLDSALFYAEQGNNLIKNISSDLVRIEVYKNLGDIYNAQGNFAISLTYYFDAKTIIDNHMASDPDDIEYIQSQLDLLIKIGGSFFYQKNYEQSMHYFNEAVLVLEKAVAIHPDLSSNYKLRLFNNIAAVHIQRFEYDKAIEYYKICLEINAIDRNDNIEASLSNNLGICYLEKNEFNLAFYYFQQALAIREKLGDKRGIAQCYNNIGKHYVLQNQFTEAENYFLKALNLGKEIGNKESILNSLKSLSSIYDELEKYKEALSYFRQFKSISDSLFNIESINRIAQLEMQYKFEKQEKLFDLELKRREAIRQKSELIFLIAGGSLFFLLLTSILLIFLQRSKIKNTLLVNDKMELEHKHMLLEKQSLKEELEFKNRELTTNVMYLLKKNELITGISGKLIKSKLDFKVENQKIIQEIINELKSSQDKDIWSEFEAHFTQVHTDFYNRLNDLFPNLSSNEKKLCAFLRLNMSTKDISAITYQSVNSITVARSRLRKKLNIQGEEVNLINFLMQL